eukprot:scaffold46265_cov47-Phaeocystis_antarctica.AAC.4
MPCHCWLTCAGEWSPAMSMARSDSESALHCKRRARSISALRRAAGPLSRPLRSTRRPPTALTSRTSSNIIDSSSTGSNLTVFSSTDSRVELGGLGGSEAGLAPLNMMLSAASFADTLQRSARGGADLGLETIHLIRGLTNLKLL